MHAELGDSLSWRRLGVLIDNLPGDDLVMLGLSDVPTWDWTRELLRTLIDSVNANTWMVQAVNVPKKDRVAFPDNLLRPWEHAERAARARKGREAMRERLLEQRERVRKERGEAVKHG